MGLSWVDFEIHFRELFSHHITNSVYPEYTKEPQGTSRNFKEPQGTSRNLKEPQGTKQASGRRA